MWSESVYALGQRLQLRLGRGHEVVVAYDEVRRRLVESAEAGGDDAASETVIARFEAAREVFLNAAQLALDAPVKDKEMKP